MATLPRNYTDQVSFYATMAAQLNSLTSISQPVFLNQATEPTQKQWEDAWTAMGNTLPIDIRSELYWYDGTRLRGMYGTIDDWVRREISTIAHYIKPSLLTGAIQHGASQFLGDDSYVLLYTDTGASGSANNLLGKVVQGAFSNINTGAATPVATSPIRTNPAGTKIAFKDSAGNLRTINTDGTGLTTVLATVCGQICDWKSTKILYIDSSNVIKYIDEAGTGNTTVLAKYGAIIKGARFDATLTRIYYAVDTEIRSVLLNGTGDQIESYVGDFTIIDTYGTTEIVYKENLQNVLVGTTVYTTPVYKKATITDIKNTSVEFNYPIDFRDVLNTFKQANPLRGGTAFHPFGIPPYSPMRNFFRANSSLTQYYSQVLIDDISPNNKNVLMTTRNGDLYLGTNRNAGYNSTGRTYRFHHWEEPVPDFQKIGTLFINAGNVVSSLDIPQTFTHLLLEGAIAVSAGSGTLLVRFNDDSVATNYMSFRVTNAAAQSKTESLALTGAAIAVIGTTLTPYKAWIPNYRGTHVKSVMGTHAFTAATGVQRTVAVWNNTTAITKISAVFDSGLTPIGTSTINVYGINGQGRYW